MAKEIPAQPPFVTTVTRSLLVEHAALDEQLLNPEDRLWCWFCYNAYFTVWADAGFVTMRCSTGRACETYYAGWAREPYLWQRKRFRCTHCGEMYFKLKAGVLKCWKCGLQETLPMPLKGITALILPEVRAQHRELGFLESKPKTGPTFHLAFNLDPWKPRVDLPNQALRRRLARYRRKELEKIEAGYDPTRDLRMMRVPW